MALAFLLLGAAMRCCVPIRLTRSPTTGQVKLGAEMIAGAPRRAATKLHFHSE